MLTGIEINNIKVIKMAKTLRFIFIIRLLEITRYGVSAAGLARSRTLYPV